MFKVGDKVICSRWVGIGEVVEIHPAASTVYQVIVSVPGDSRHFSFTNDGRYCVGDAITLFHVKEESIMEKVTVTIQVTKSFEITKADQQLILDLMNDKFKAIKFIRAQHDLPLIEAKRLCKVVWEAP